MRDTFIAAVVAAAWVATAAGAETAPVHAHFAGLEAGFPPIWQAIRDAQEALEAGQIERAAQLYEAAIAAPHFPELDPDRQHEALASAASIASRRGEHERALSHYVQSSSNAFASAEDWIGRFRSAWLLGHKAEAAFALARLATHWPARVKQLNDAVVYDVIAAIDASHAQSLRFELLTALFAADWHTSLGREPSDLWIQLIEILVERGEIARAVDVAARVRDPLDTIRLLSDQRFRSVVESAPGWFDVAETLEIAIVETRLTAATFPNRFAPVIQLSRALRLSGRPEAALDALDDAIGRAALARLLGDPFADHESHFVWVLDEKSRALVALGRWNEAVEQLRLATRQTRIDGGTNIDQSINLGLLLVHLARPERALAAVADIQQDATAEGRALIEFVRFAAALELGDADLARGALSYLRTHADANTSIVQSALLIAGDIDGAAAILKRRLADPEQRGIALDEVQQFRAPRVPPMQAKWRLNRRALLERSDVRAAIEQVGSIGSYELHVAN